MIWHIVKKDFRLLWPLIAPVALAQAVSASLWVILSPFGEPRGLASLATVFSMAAILGIVILIITAVHSHRLGERSPQVFYALAFLMSFGLMTRFDSARWLFSWAETLARPVAAVEHTPVRAIDTHAN
jgi:hypothetical protein